MCVVVRSGHGGSAGKSARAPLGHPRSEVECGENHAVRRWVCRTTWRAGQRRCLAGHVVQRLSTFSGIMRYRLILSRVRLFCLVPNDCKLRLETVFSDNRIARSSMRLFYPFLKTRMLGIAMNATTRYPFCATAAITSARKKDGRTVASGRCNMSTK